jgi:soluble lytic murein transglycosylase
VVYQESRFSPRAVSPVGAVGLMQLMPGTADEMARQHGLAGPLNLSAPELNLRLGTSYLKSLLDRYQGDLVEALAAYNGGPSNVERWSGADLKLSLDEIGYPETRQFVASVLAHREQYRRLYPEL